MMCCRRETGISRLRLRAAARRSVKRGPCTTAFRLRRPQHGTILSSTETELLGASSTTPCCMSVTVCQRLQLAISAHSSLACPRRLANRARNMTTARGWALDRMHTSRRPRGAASLSGVTAEPDGTARLSRRDFLHFLTLVTLTFDLLT